MELFSFRITVQRDNEMSIRCTVLLSLADELGETIVPTLLTGS